MQEHQILFNSGLKNYIQQMNSFWKWYPQEKWKKSSKDLTQDLRDSIQFSFIHNAQNHNKWNLKALQRHCPIQAINNPTHCNIIIIKSNSSNSKLVQSIQSLRCYGKQQISLKLQLISLPDIYHNATKDSC